MIADTTMVDTAAVVVQQLYFRCFAHVKYFTCRSGF